jgi:hypothetical protein
MNINILTYTQHLIDKAKKWYVLNRLHFDPDRMTAATLLFEGTNEEINRQERQIYAIAKKHGMRVCVCLCVKQYLCDRQEARYAYVCVSVCEGERSMRPPRSTVCVFDIHIYRIFVSALHVYLLSHTPTQTLTHTSTHTLIHTHPQHKHLCTHIHTHTHTNTHIHTPRRHEGRRGERHPRVLPDIHDRVPARLRIQLQVCVWCGVVWCVL